MNYFTLAQKNLPIAKPQSVACKLDSKARLVLPLAVREKLSVSKGGTVLLEIDFSESKAGRVTINLSKGTEQRKGLQRTSKNNWEAGK